MGQGPRPSRAKRAIRPVVEALDGRALLSTLPVAGGKLGPFVEPGAFRPRIRQSPTVVEATPALNRHLSLVFGPEAMEPIRAQARSRGVASRAILHQRVVSQPPIATVLGSVDTYALLNAPATRLLVGYVPIVIPPAESPEDPGPDLTPDPTVPDVPDIPPPLPVTTPTGVLAPAYRPTGPVLSQALLTGLHRRGPNTPAVVRGLRLARAFGDPGVVAPGVPATYLRLFRVAVERNAFQPTAEQGAAIAAGVAQFLVEVGQLATQGAFTPPVPPETPANLLGGATLGGTVQVTTGAVRDLSGVSASQAGLPLGAAAAAAGLSQATGLVLPGRIDAGFVVAANGDYGLVLSARGPLLDAPAGFATDVVGGDVRVELSNAASLADLNGVRVSEATYSGTVASGEIAASRTPGPLGDLVTLSGAAGLGAGLAFGTSVSYTRIIPLGNLNALLPQYPGP